MNLGPTVGVAVVVGALGLTVHAAARALSSGHVGWGLAILLLPGVRRVDRDPLPGRTPARDIGIDAVSRPSSMSRLRFKVHAVIQMDERAISIDDVRTALENGEDIESRPDERPYPARLVSGMCRLGALHVAVRDNIDADELIVETAYVPDPALWEPDFKTRRTKR